MLRHSVCREDANFWLGQSGLTDGQIQRRCDVYPGVHASNDGLHSTRSAACSKRSSG